MGKTLHAFSFEANGVVRRIVTPVKISKPTRAANPNSAEVITVDALWDTGATGSVITPTVAKTLNLSQIGQENVEGFGGTHNCPRHVVDLYLSDLLRFGAIEVSEAPKDTAQFGFIIGMDIIAEGDFTVCHNGGKSLISYQYPSTHSFNFNEEVLKSNVRIYLKALKRMNPKEKVNVTKLDGTESKTVSVRKAKNLVQHGWALQ